MDPSFFHFMFRWSLTVGLGQGIPKFTVCMGSKFCLCSLLAWPRLLRSISSGALDCPVNVGSSGWLQALRLQRGALCSSSHPQGHGALAFPHPLYLSEL